MLPSKPKVLIVDDSDANRLVLRRLAVELGAETIEAADGAQGLVAARGNDIALILLDLQMPVMDGFEATRLLRAAPRTSHIPIIMITEVRVGLADQRHGLDLGAIAYLNRNGLDFAALKEQMRELIDLHVRANDLQVRISSFLADSARLSASNEQIRALQSGLHRHLLLDRLTGLPNRMYFDLHLDIALKRAARGGRPFGVAWIDLDHVGRVVERHGAEAGDGLMLAVATRMENVVRASDVLACIGPSSFGIVLDGVTDAAGAELALKKVLAVSGEPLDVGKNGSTVTLIPTLSVGGAIYPRHGKDRETLMNRAANSAVDVLAGGGDGVRIG